MHNININKVIHHSYSEEYDIIKGVHCGTFVCLLVKQEESENQQSYYVKQLISNDVNQTIKIDIGNEIVTSKLEYLPLENSVFVSTSASIYLVDFKCGKVTTIKIPSENHDSVIATAWNCEQDSLAIAYNSDRIMIYCINFHTYQMTVLAEDHPDHKGDESVYLGWGNVKKQFKGKAVAEYLKESHPPESGYKHLLQNASISWQFGEKYFCVNSLCGKEHIIRIFDNECKLFYTITNAKVPGICTKTVFRSKHNTLATVCQGDDSKSYVVMHERNGEYYNTVVPFSNANVEDIQFSTCGRIFAILSHSKKNYFLDLYMQSNFQWVHKYRFTGGAEKKIIAFKFNTTEEEIYPIEMIFNGGMVVYELSKTITSLLDHHTVYVQSGNNLQEFDYRKCVIPPCGVTDTILTTQEPINNVVVQEMNGKSLLVLIDALEVAHAFQRHNGKWLAVDKFNLKRSYCDLPITWYLFVLTVVDETVCLIAIGMENNSCIRRIVRIDGDKENSIQELIPNIAFLYTAKNNSVHMISPDIYAKTIRSAYNFHISESYVLCALAYNGELFVNRECIAKGITSMLNYNDLYLLMTITSFDDPMDRLVCIDVQRFENTLPNIYEISWSRRVEKGAILICSANKDGSVILEMPRGNIELIAVRPIILRMVYNKLSNDMFLEAYHLVRRLAMKLDVLYDLAPQLFLQNVNVFVRSLGSSEAVIKFMLPLKNESTLTRNDFLFVDEHEVNDKMNQICEAIIQVYIDLKCDENDTSYYRIICLALFVKHNYHTYESLRFLVNRIGGIYTPTALHQLIDVVNVLKIYGDPVEMYKQALTLYDVELVATIAQLAGMDPQVYRRFLKMCHDADPITRRFLMANEGGNFKSAGLYMLILYRKQRKTLEEFIAYVKDKAVLDDVYKAMDKGDGDAILRVAQLLCEKYTIQLMFKEGATVLCKTGLNLKAIDLLIDGVCWKEAVQIIMNSHNLSCNEKLNWFEKLANACIAHGKHRESAYIYLEKCSNVDKALDCYLKGQYFNEVVDILIDSNLTTQINRDVYLGQLKDDLLDNMKNVEESLDSRGKMFDTHYERLKIVREDRKNRAECTLDGDDAYSEAGSVTTRSHSSYASTTTRRTRKHEMKLRSLRHGGKFEDIALMRELFDVMSDVFNMANCLHKLENVYITYAQIQTDTILNRIAKLQRRMKEAASDIWIPEYANFEDDVLTADFLTENIVHLSKEFRSMPDNMKDD